MLFHKKKKTNQKRSYCKQLLPIFRENVRDIDWRTREREREKGDRIVSGERKKIGFSTADTYMTG